MVVYVQSIETPTEVILEWTADTEGDSLTNWQGVKSSHVTEMLEGQALLEIEGLPDQTLNAGDTIILPTHTPYTFTALRPGRMQCHYRKDIPGQVKEIEHLRTEGRVRMTPGTPPR